MNLACEISEMRRVMIERPTDKLMWNLRTLMRNADILASKLGEAISENQGGSLVVHGRTYEDKQRVMICADGFSMEY